MLTDPTPDEESGDVRDVVRRFLSDRLPTDRVREQAATPAGYDPADWRQMVEMGWPALGVPESMGGAGYGAVGQCVLLEEFGRSLAGGPMLACAGFALPVLLACDDSAATALVEGVVGGDTVVVFVDGTGGRVSATPDGELRGGVGLVLDGQNADELVVQTDVEGEPALVVVPADRALVEPVAVLDPTRRFARVTFDGAGGRRLRTVSAARLASARDVQAVHHAAQLAGGATRTLEMTLDHLRTRTQFGKPIGTFQALKHRCADAAVAVALTRELVYAAAAGIDARRWDDVATASRAALLRAATVYQQTAAEAIQLHGGIGFTEEHDIGLYYRRAVTDRDLCGDVADLREQLAVAIGL